MPNLQLKKFDIKSIKDGSVIVFIGKRDTGKSFLVKDMLYYKQDLPIGTVISGTEGANTFYGNIVPGLFIHDEFNPGKQSWSLEVTLSENEERVNIDHDVTITYNDEESKPNPLPTQEQ